MKTFRFLPALWQRLRWRRWSLSQICLRWRLASLGQPWPPSPAPQAALAPASRLSTQMTRKTWGSFNVTTATVHFIYTHSKKRCIRISVGEFQRVGQRWRWFCLLRVAPERSYGGLCRWGEQLWSGCVLQQGASEGSKRNSSRERRWVRRRAAGFLVY